MNKTENLKVTLGDFELMQLIMNGLGFECVSQSRSVNKKIYRKHEVTVIIDKLVCDE